ncbi:hypothetical protein MHYP_G00059060 [Metynnis hypsauchen]
MNSVDEGEGCSQCSRAGLQEEEEEEEEEGGVLLKVLTAISSLQKADDPAELGAAGRVLDSLLLSFPLRLFISPFRSFRPDFRSRWERAHPRRAPGRRWRTQRRRYGQP